MMTLQNVEAPSAQRFDGSREHRPKPQTSRTILPDSVVIVAEPDDSGIFNPLTKAPPRTKRRRGFLFISHD